MMPGTVPEIKQVCELALLLYDAFGALYVAASSHVKLGGRDGTVIVGFGAGRTSIVLVSVIAGLPQLSPGSIVHVIVIVPPQIVKSSDFTPGTAPLISQGDDEPLPYVALGGLYVVASPQVRLEGSCGTLIEGGAAGVTGIVAVSCTL